VLEPAKHGNTNSNTITAHAQHGHPPPLHEEPISPFDVRTPDPVLPLPVPVPVPVSAPQQHNETPEERKRRLARNRQRRRREKLKDQAKSAAASNTSVPTVTTLPPTTTTTPHVPIPHVPHAVPHAMPLEYYGWESVFPSAYAAKCAVDTAVGAFQDAIRTAASAEREFITVHGLSQIAKSNHISTERFQEFITSAISAHNGNANNINVNINGNGNINGANYR